MAESGSCVLSEEEFRRRVIQPSDFVADPRAFVDVRLARSKGKESYSFIGPGVSQNTEQTINLTELHGFNVGAAFIPGGVVNNPHLHFTAEIFICTRGSFRFTVGLGESASSVLVSEGDVLSVPTWVFRSFENVGSNDGWVFTCLGKDETGGIIWAPNILQEAAETGLYLASDSSLIDTMSGGSVTGVELVAPMTPAEIFQLPVLTEDDLAQRLVRSDELQWISDALLSSAVDGHDFQLAPVLGWGLNQARGAKPALADAHGVSMEWLSVAPSSETGRHTTDVPHVVYVISGDWEIEVNAGDERLTARPAPESVISLPAGTWRNLRNVGSDPATAVLVSGGDGRPRVLWDDAIVAEANARNITVDANGYLAPANVVERRPR